MKRPQQIASRSTAWMPIISNNFICFCRASKMGKDWRSPKQFGSRFFFGTKWGATIRWRGRLEHLRPILPHPRLEWQVFLPPQIPLNVFTMCLPYVYGGFLIHGGTPRNIMKHHPFLGFSLKPSGELGGSPMTSWKPSDVYLSGVVDGKISSMFQWSHKGSNDHQLFVSVPLCFSKDPGFRRPSGVIQRHFWDVTYDVTYDVTADG